MADNTIDIRKYIKDKVSDLKELITDGCDDLNKKVSIFNFKITKQSINLLNKVSKSSKKPIHITILNENKSIPDISIDFNKYRDIINKMIKVGYYKGHISKFMKDVSSFKKDTDTSNIDQYFNNTKDMIKLEFKNADDYFNICMNIQKSVNSQLKIILKDYKGANKKMSDLTFENVFDDSIYEESSLGDNKRLAKDANAVMRLAKDEIKNCRKAVKDGEFDKATQALQRAKNYVKTFKKNLDGTDAEDSQWVLLYPFIVGTAGWLPYLKVSGTFKALAKGYNPKEYLEITKEYNTKIKNAKDDEEKEDLKKEKKAKIFLAYNAFKNYAKASIEEIFKAIDDEDKKVKEAKKQKSKPTTESVLNIYNAYDAYVSGDLTFESFIEVTETLDSDGIDTKMDKKEEKEIDKLSNEGCCGKEGCGENKECGDGECEVKKCPKCGAVLCNNPSTDTEPEQTPDDKLATITKVIYDKYNKGDMTIEEREEAIIEARRLFGKKDSKFNLTCENSSADALKKVISNYEKACEVERKRQAQNFGPLNSKYKKEFEVRKNRCKNDLDAFKHKVLKTSEEIGNLQQKGTGDNLKQQIERKHDAIKDYEKQIKDLEEALKLKLDTVTE